MATERQYLDTGDKTAKSLHEKALTLLRAFVPDECPLLVHISDSYERKFANKLEEIVSAMQPEEVPSLPVLSRRQRSMLPVRKPRRRSHERASLDMHRLYTQSLSFSNESKTKKLLRRRPVERAEFLA